MYDLDAWEAASLDRIECLQYMIEQGCGIMLGNQHSVYQKHNVVIARAMSRRRSAMIIQRGWRIARMAKRIRAAKVIEEAYISWACSAPKGAWYLRAMQSFHEMS